MTVNYSKLKEVLGQGDEPHLMTGDQYKESLRDGRRVIDTDGNEIEDVTSHPALKRSVNLLAELYDAQFDSEHQDLMTYVDSETGKRHSLAWKLPQNKEDLIKRRELSKFTTSHTLGLFGRPNDYGSMAA